MQTPANDNQPEVISRADAIARGFIRYFTGKPCKRGHVAERGTAGGTCLACHVEVQRNYRAENPEAVRAAKQKSVAKHADKVMAYRKKYHEDNRSDVAERFRHYWEKNKGRERERCRRYHAENSGKVRAQQKQWRDQNPHKVRAKGAMRSAAKIRATPPWLSESQKQEIQAIYALRVHLTKQTGVLHHVDHIVPLRNPDVCGLHVPWNLRVIPANDNLRKSNKITA